MSSNLQEDDTFCCGENHPMDFKILYDGLGEPDDIIFVCSQCIQEIQWRTGIKTLFCYKCNREHSGNDFCPLMPKEKCCIDILHKSDSKHVMIDNSTIEKLDNLGKNIQDEIGIKSSYSQIIEYLFKKVDRKPSTD